MNLFISIICYNIDILFPTKFRRNCALILHKNKKMVTILKISYYLVIFVFRKVLLSKAMSRHKDTKIHFLITS